MDIILIAGLWLPVATWDDVAERLASRGHRAWPVALPGVDDSSRHATLDEQLESVQGVVDTADRPLVVGHSAACALAWMAADRRADRIAGVAMIGGFPATHGASYADHFAVEDGVVPFPGWDAFDEPDIRDLDDAARTHVESAVVPVPIGVATGTVELFDERRFGVPVVMICPEYTPEQARGWLDDGHMPELEQARSVSYVDLDSGHWPHISAPAHLTRVLDRIASELDPSGG